MKNKVADAYIYDQHLLLITSYIVFVLQLNSHWLLACSIVEINNAIEKYISNRD